MTAFPPDSSGRNVPPQVALATSVEMTSSQPKNGTFGTIAMATAQQAAAVGLQHSQAGACETHLTHNAEDHQSARELICTFRPLVAEHINRSLNSHTTHETFVIMYAEDHDRLEFNGGKYADYLWPKAFNGETCTSPLELQEMPFLRQYGTDAISMVPPKEPIVVWDPEGTSPPGSRMYTLKVHIMRLLIVMATTRSDKLAVQAFDRDGNALKGSGYLSTDAPHNWPRTHGISQFGFNHFCSVLLFGALSHPMQCIMLHPQSHGRVGRGLDGFWGRVVNFSPKLGWHCAGASNVNSRLVTQDGRYPMPTSPEILQLHQLQNATTFTGGYAHITSASVLTAVTPPDAYTRPRLYVHRGCVPNCRKWTIQLAPVQLACVKPGRPRGFPPIMYRIDKWQLIDRQYEHLYITMQ